MGTSTTNLGLYKPDVGETGWGTLVNGNFDVVDAMKAPFIIIDPKTVDLSGTTDCSAVLQAAIDALPQTSTISGGTILLPVGALKVSTMLDLGLKKNIVIRGAGAVHYGAASNGGTTLFTGTAGMTLLRSGNGTSILQDGPRIEGIHFRDAAGTSPRLVHFWGVNRYVMRDCSFGDGVGIEIDAGTANDASWSLIEQCHFRDCPTGILATKTFGFIVFGGEFTQSATHYGIDVVNGQHVRILNIKVDHGQAVRLHGTSCSLIGIEYESQSAAAETAIELLSTSGPPPVGSENSIIGCSIRGTGRSDFVGIHIGTGATDTKIVSPHFINIGPGTGTKILDDSKVRTHITGGSDACDMQGTGSPEGVYTAAPGATFRSLDTGSFYIKGSGTSNTGWSTVALGGATGVGVTSLTWAKNEADQTNYTTVSISPTSGKAWVAWVTATRTATTPPQPTMTGAGLTWTHHTSVDWATDGGVKKKLSLFVGTGTPSAGTCNIDYGGTTVTAALWDIWELTGIHATTPVVQAVTAINNATPTTLAIALAAPAAAVNRAAAAFCHATAEAMTPRTNWTEVSDQTTSSPGCSLETQWRSDGFFVDASASWATGDKCGGIAIELKAI